MATYVQYIEPYPQSRGDRFGATAGRRNAHRGQDTAPGGKPAVALADGQVVGIRGYHAGGKLENGVLGLVVVTRHADGKFVGQAHLASISAHVGQTVKRGQQLGVIGNTGSASAGRHLHYTLGDDVWGVEVGHVQDPLPYITARTAPLVRPAGVVKRVLGRIVRAGRGWDWWEPRGELAKRVQRALAGRGRYNLPNGAWRPIDGEFGFYTRCGVQETLRRSGVFAGRIDGLPGKGAAFGVQDYACRFGSYRGKRDGKPRDLSWAAFALGLERP